MCKRICQQNRLRTHGTNLDSERSNWIGGTTCLNERVPSVRLNWSQTYKRIQYNTYIAAQVRDTRTVKRNSIRFTSWNIREDSNKKNKNYVSNLRNTHLTLVFFKETFASIVCRCSDCERLCYNTSHRHHKQLRLALRLNLLAFATNKIDNGAGIITVYRSVDCRTS